VDKIYRQRPKAAGRTGTEASHRHEGTTATDSISRIAAVAGEDDVVAEAALGGGTETDQHQVTLAAPNRKRARSGDSKRRRDRNTARQHQLPRVEYLKLLCAA